MRYKVRKYVLDILLCSEFYCTDCELTGVPDIAVQLQVYVNSDNFPPHVRVKLQVRH